MRGVVVVGQRHLPGRGGSSGQNSNACVDQHPRRSGVQWKCWDDLQLEGHYRALSEDSKHHWVLCRYSRVPRSERRSLTHTYHADEMRLLKRRL